MKTFTTIDGPIGRTEVEGPTSDRGSESVMSAAMLPARPAMRTPEEIEKTAMERIVMYIEASKHHHNSLACEMLYSKAVALLWVLNPRWDWDETFRHTQTIITKMRTEQAP